jgi:hypothetical protein
MTALMAKAFSSLQYKELKTNIFHTGKPLSILHHLSELHMRRDGTYSMAFGSIEITAVCNVTQNNLVEMQQCLWRNWYVHIHKRMVSHCGPVQLSRYSDSLRARRSRDQILVGARFSASVQTSPGVHPASYTMGSGYFHRVKWVECGVDHPP